MTAAHDYEDMHRLVDRMTLAQVRELRRQALRLVDLSDESDESERSDGGQPPIRRLSFAGALSAEHDLAARSEDILREELG